MATGSVALIVTNAIRGLFYDDNGDNLKLSFAGATEMPRIIFFAHEFHELTRRQCATGMATGSVARIGTNAMRGGLRQVLWRTAFQAESTQSPPPEDFVPGYHRYAL